MAKVAGREELRQQTQPHGFSPAALGAAWQSICISDAKGDIDLSILTSAEVITLFKSRFRG